jgi:hypothetical protein
MKRRFWPLVVLGALAAGSCGPVNVEQPAPVTAIRAPAVAEVAPRKASQQAIDQEEEEDQRLYLLNGSPGYEFDFDLAAIKPIIDVTTDFSDGVASGDGRYVVKPRRDPETFLWRLLVKDTTDRSVREVGLVWTMTRPQRIKWNDSSLEFEQVLISGEGRLYRVRFPEERMISILPFLGGNVE